MENKLKFPNELDLQKAIIETCKKEGGFGDKIQDKFVKGKCDIWLKLPENGPIVFIEVKINENVKEIVKPKFSIPQLEYMEKLHEHGVATLAICFATRKIIDRLVTYYRICPPAELKRKWETNNVITYSIDQYLIYADLKYVIHRLREFYK